MYIKLSKNNNFSLIFYLLYLFKAQNNSIFAAKINRYEYKKNVGFYSLHRIGYLYK